MFTAVVFCFYCLAGVLGAPSLNSGNSAVPPSALKVHSSIVCEGQKAYVSCSSIFDQIEVIETMYGRKDKTTCVHPSIPSDTECQEQGAEVQKHIKGMCEGEHSCEVAANNNFMAKAGTVICPDVYKYLQIRYRCVPRTYYPNSYVASTELGQSVSEVISGGPVETGSSASSSSFPLSAYVPVITVHEHAHVEPITTATSQGSVTQIDLHKGMTAGSDITEEFSQAGDNTDVVTETFPSTSMRNAAEVSETFKKSSTPEQPQESGDDSVSNEASASGILDDFGGQRDVVFDERR